MSTWTDKNGLRPPVQITHTTPEERDKARRFVATRSSCAADCRELLLMLGLIEEVAR